MSFLDDINKGREKYRRRNQMRSRTFSSRTAPSSGIFVELGSFVEFVLSKVSKSGNGKNTEPAEPKPSMIAKCVEIAKRDVDGMFRRVCKIFPEKKKKDGYDPLDAAWKRGRRG